MYYDKETERRLRREMRIFDGSDWAVGLLLGPIVAVAIVAVAWYFHVFDCKIDFLDLDLAPLLALSVYVLAAIAGVMLCMTLHRERRTNKKLEEEREKQLAETEQRKKEARLW